MNQPKTQPTKPSAGALRAADILWREYVIGTPQADGGILFPGTHKLAEIIDRETGVAELLESARACVDLAAVGADLGPKTTGAAKIADADVARLKQAIAKCEGSE